MNIIVKKGYDLELVGAPAKTLKNVKTGSTLKIFLSDFPGLKPKLLISSDDILKKGATLFVDKSNPNICFTTPVSCIVKEIKLGPRRVLEYISLSLQENNDKIVFDNYSLNEILLLDKKLITNILCKSGLWTTIRTRPFSRIAKPGNEPKAIFISTMSSAPFAVDLEVLLDNVQKDSIQAGINAISKLTRGSINLCSPSYSPNPKLDTLDLVKHHTFSGPHPAGNVGVHISNIDPIKNKDDFVWYISIQDVVQIGELFLKGETNYEKIITVAGSAVENRQHFKVIRGTLISQILSDNNFENSSRIISGDILSGNKSDTNKSLGYYHEALTIIPNSDKRKFMGWISPGFSKFSFSYTFLSKIMPKKKWSLNTLKNGSLRAIVPIGAIEKVLPLKILPTMLIKSIIAFDIENMEELGIYECSPEDFALCSFVDASKMDISSIIQQGLDYAEVEG